MKHEKNNYYNITLNVRAQSALGIIVLTTPYKVHATKFCLLCCKIIQAFCFCYLSLAVNNTYIL